MWWWRVLAGMLRDVMQRWRRRQQQLQAAPPRVLPGLVEPPGAAVQRELQRVREAAAAPVLDEQGRRLNAYACERCRRVVVTVEVDEGATPGFMMCVATRGCAGRMHSAWYNPAVIRRLPDRTPHFEWYKPRDMRGLTKDEREHVLAGGLLLRKPGEDPYRPFKRGRARARGGRPKR